MIFTTIVIVSISSIIDVFVFGIVVVTIVMDVDSSACGAQGIPTFWTLLKSRGLTCPTLAARAPAQAVPERS
jgi:hypothetical protein